MVVNLANFIEYFATPISGQVTFQRQGYESDLAFAMDAKCGMYQSSPGERTPFFGAAFCAVIGGCMSLHFRCHNICFCRITRNRQSRQRLDRHGTIVVGSCETFHHYNVQGVK